MLDSSCQGSRYTHNVRVLRVAINSIRFLSVHANPWCALEMANSLYDCRKRLHALASAACLTLVCVPSGVFVVCSPNPPPPPHAWSTFLVIDGTPFSTLARETRRIGPSLTKSSPRRSRPPSCSRTKGSWPSGGQWNNSPTMPPCSCCTRVYLRVASSCCVLHSARYAAVIHRKYVPGIVCTARDCLRQSRRFQEIGCCFCYPWK